MKSVLYLIQAKYKLPKVYSCLRSRNFILLSYAKYSSDTTIFAPNTTWTEGRNMLYEYVKRNNLFYDYYVFMDEDIILFPTSQFTKHAFINFLVFPFIHYFRFLLKFSIFPLQNTLYECLETSFEENFHILTLVNEYITNKKLPLTLLTSVIPEDYRFYPVSEKHWDLQTAAYFDAVLTAISREAFLSNTILPYEAAYDKYSWWFSSLIFQCKANHHFPNRIVRNNCIQICNFQHKEYPQSGFSKAKQAEVYRNLCRELQVENITFSKNKQITVQNGRLKSQKIKIFEYFQDLLVIFFLPAAFFEWFAHKIKRIFSTHRNKKSSDTN